MRETSVTTNGLEFGLLEEGDGPLALCLHGFPDTAFTWRHLLPRLAEAGFRGVAPFLRGYAPTGVPADGRFQTGALSADALALHDALGGDEDAVIIGHDWGAFATYGAAVNEPDRWRRVVTVAVPPLAAMANAYFTYDQVKRSFYIFFFQTPFADVAVPLNDLEFVARLWEDWSPGYDATEDLRHVRASIGEPENLSAAIGYYRAMFDQSGHDPALADLQAATSGIPPQPTLYLHGRGDGCLGVELTEDVGGLLAPGSRVRIVDGAGHFLQLEKPDEVNDAIVDFVSSD